jgi:hypothetical protein
VLPRASLSRAKHALSRVEGSREYPCHDAPAAMAILQGYGGVFPCIGGRCLLY